MSFFFFTCALRQAHDCYHHSIGLNRPGVRIMLHLLSIAMLCSTHAIRHTHLQHHRDPLGEGDVEGNWARLPAWKAILFGGLFSVRIQWQGLMHGSRATRSRSRFDMFLIAAFIAAALITRHPVLLYHTARRIRPHRTAGLGKLRHRLPALPHGTPPVCRRPLQPPARTRPPPRCRRAGMERAPRPAAAEKATLPAQTPAAYLKPFQTASPSGTEAV